MIYKVSLTAKQTTTLANLKANNHTQEHLLSIFTSYVGQTLASSTNARSRNLNLKFVIGMVNTWPELANVKSFKQLYSEQGNRFVEGEMQLYDREAATSKIFKPGVGTPITNPELNVEVNDHMPVDAQIAAKYMQLYKSAMKRNLEWNLELIDIAKILKRKTCYYTGARMKGTGCSRRTVDRIDSDKGYVKGNVVACTYTANQLKNYLFENDRSEIRTTKKMLEKLLTRLPD